MKLICYDIGSYSLKKSEYLEDKNFLREIGRQEFVLNGPFENFPPKENSEEENDQTNKNLEEVNQYDWLNEVVEIFIKEKNLWSNNDKVVLLLPEDFSTSRYLTLPVNSKKKAAQILPFQLEDSIPFSMNDIAYQAKYYPTKDSTDVLVNIIGPKDLESLYSKLEKQEIYFDLITTNIGVLSSFSSQQKTALRNFGTENFAIIDIGHLGTSCFFFHHGRLVANHNSISSGALLTENLADSYNISPQEAKNYKHEEAFFLTSRQLDAAEKDEKIFALFMERTFSNLITDFSRWHLGYRTKTNDPIDKVFFVGGSTKIQNICPFFDEHFNVDCEELVFTNKKLNIKESSQLSSITAALIFDKVKPLNFLSGKFKARKSSIIPLSESFQFFNRTSILSSIVCFFVLIDLLLNIYSSSKIEKSFKNKLLKNKIDITKKQQITYRKKPDRLLPVLTKKIKNIKNIKKSIDSINQHMASNALSALFKISTNNNFFISDFSYENDLKIILDDNEQTSENLKNINDQFKIVENKKLGDRKIELLLELK